MNKVASQKHVLLSWRLPIHLVGLLLLFLSLTACFGGGNEAAEETAVTLTNPGQQNGTLTCSESCSLQGQCGTTLDGRVVILGHSNVPSTRDHNTVLPNESTVTVLAQEPHTVADAAGVTSTLNFFAIQPLDGGPASWVAGTCVNLQPTQ